MNILRDSTSHTECFMKDRNGSLPFGASSGTIHVRIADDIEKHQLGWDMVEILKKVGMGNAIGILIEAYCRCFSIISGIIAKMAANLPLRTMYQLQKISWKCDERFRNSMFRSAMLLHWPMTRFAGCA
jgi:hypothetical protein